MEGFVDIIGYEGLYMINKEGDIWSNKLKNCKVPSVSWDGYAHISLSKNNIRKTFKLHRLLGIHFLDNPNNFKQIDHIDRNRLNNNLNNLRWSNQSDNMMNITKQKNNKSGFKNISSQDNGWIIRIKLPNMIYTKYFNKNNYTIDEVVAIRDIQYTLNGIKKFD
jgi:hypothetical protein